MKRVLLACAILVALVGTASAFDLSPDATPLQNVGPVALSSGSAVSSSYETDIVEPDLTCRWIFMGGQWIQYCI